MLALITTSFRISAQKHSVTDFLKKIQWAGFFHLRGKRIVEITYVPYSIHNR